VGPCLGLPLLEVDWSSGLCDKEKLCANASLIHLPQHVNAIDTSVFINPLVLKLNI
jgi:hypothetical protein